MGRVLYELCEVIDDKEVHVIFTRLQGDTNTQKEGDNVNKQSPRGFVRAKSNTQHSFFPQGENVETLHEREIERENKRGREG